MQQKPQHQNSSAVERAAHLSPEAIPFFGSSDNRSSEPLLYYSDTAPPVSK